MKTRNPNGRQSSDEKGGSDDGEIAAGVKVFTRTGRLETLLSTIPSDVISTVYVVDDGPEEQRQRRRQRLYDRSYPFSLEVFEFEAGTVGLGESRALIVEESTADYLLMLDSDHRVPENVDTLRAVLQSRPNLGGVTGSLLDIETDRFTIQAADFTVNGGTFLIDPFLEEKEIRTVTGNSLIEFDFIGYPALFRRECLDSYSWDPHYNVEGEHGDFYLGHWERTRWTFGVCPEVVFQHQPGGTDDYLDQRWYEWEEVDTDTYFLDKWGLDDWHAASYEWYSEPLWKDDGFQGLFTQSLIKKNRLNAIVKDKLRIKHEGQIARFLHWCKK